MNLPINFDFLVSLPWHSLIIIILFYFILFYKNVRICNVMIIKKYCYCYYREHCYCCVVLNIIYVEK